MAISKTGNLIRLNTHVDKRHNEELRIIAKEFGVSVSEVVRRALEFYLLALKNKNCGERVNARGKISNRR